MYSRPETSDISVVTEKLNAGCGVGVRVGVAVWVGAVVGLAVGCEVGEGAGVGEAAGAQAARRSNVREGDTGKKVFHRIYCIGWEDKAEDDLFLSAYGKIKRAGTTPKGGRQTRPYNIIYVLILYGNNCVQVAPPSTV